MTTYVLGAGASIHAGYPLARDLGTRLYDWVKTNVPSGDFWRGCVEELHEVYGGLDDIESILAELEEGPAGSPAARLKPGECPRCGAIFDPGHVQERPREARCAL